MHPWTLYALEISRDRERELESNRLVIAAHADDEGRSFVRRPMAVALAALSRGSAAAARRLDECVADDLSRSFAATK
jgi:hypothetical protein